jgi:adenylate cyclase, class 2
MAIETEKKYRLDKRLLVELTAKLGELGAVFLSERFEENYLHRGGLLDENNAVLRLRKVSDQTFLTYKERIRSETEFKHKIEFETLVSDVDAVENMIEKLGYKLSVVYEKHRKTFNLGECEVVLDELPFGQYMEIEGSKGEILKVEKMLGAQALEPETRGYPRLTTKYGKQVGSVYEARFERAKTA